MGDPVALQARVDALLEDLELLRAENARLTRTTRMLQAALTAWYIRVRGAHSLAVQLGATELAEYLRKGKTP